MQLNIQGSAIADSPAVRRHIEQRSFFELARYGGRIAVVRVRVAERPRSADTRFHCGVAVTIDHGEATPGIVLARGQGDDLQALIASVLERAGHQAGGEIARADAAGDARAQWMKIAVGGDRGIHEPVRGLDAALVRRGNPAARS
jgi:ribosome-associated translation inhibitor RaiA